VLHGAASLSVQASLTWHLSPCCFDIQARILEVLDNVCSAVPQAVPLDSKKGKKIVNDAVGAGLTTTELLLHRYRLTWWSLAAVHVVCRRIRGRADADVLQRLHAGQGPHVHQYAARYALHQLRGIDLPTSD
jgi:hypothetical protein